MPHDFENPIGASADLCLEPAMLHQRRFGRSPSRRPETMNRCRPRCVFNRADLGVAIGIPLYIYTYYLHMCYVYTYTHIYNKCVLCTYVHVFLVGRSVGLGWVGLGWVGLGWVEVGLGWGWVGWLLGWVPASGWLCTWFWLRVVA